MKDCSMGCKDCKDYKSITTRKQCSVCSYYKFIDSGYGYCYGLPPQIVTYGLFGETKYEYPTVPWCNMICSLFKRKEK